MNKNKVIVKSPLYTEVTHTFMMTDDQLFVYNKLTDNGKLMTLKIFGELTRRGCLKKLWFEKKSKIRVH